MRDSRLRKLSRFSPGEGDIASKIRERRNRKYTLKHRQEIRKMAIYGLAKLLGNIYHKSKDRNNHKLGSEGENKSKGEASIEEEEKVLPKEENKIEPKEILKNQDIISNKYISFESKLNRQNSCRATTANTTCRATDTKRTVSKNIGSIVSDTEAADTLCTATNTSSPVKPDYSAKTDVSQHKLHSRSTFQAEHEACGYSISHIFRT